MTVVNVYSDVKRIEGTARRDSDTNKIAWKKELKSVENDVNMKYHK